SSFAALIGSPIYYIPLFAPLCILIATVIVAAARRSPGAATALVVVLAAITVPFAVNRVALNHRISTYQEPWKAARAKVHAGDLVFVHDTYGYLMQINPYSRNDPGLQKGPLYAVEAGLPHIRLIHR